MTFNDLTELVCYGVSLGFGLSLILWGIALIPRAFMSFLRR
jgi:hypothetical protein